MPTIDNSVARRTLVKSKSDFYVQYTANYKDIEIARTRIAEYSRLAHEDFDFENARIADDLERFIQENPERHRYNCLEALRA